MKSFKQWLREMTTTASVAIVPMRQLADRGRPYIGVPGRPSPYDKKGRPTVIRRPSLDDREESKFAQEFPYKWLDRQYGRNTKNPTKGRRRK